jgi:DTW domain-containing protein
MLAVMSRRNPDARCATCHMYRALCICAITPRLVTRTRLVLLVHYREARKPTNTGLLATRALPNSTVAIIGDQDRTPLPEIPINALLLFPSESAVPIAGLCAPDTPRTLVVPDGNWRQAGKMAKRVPGLAGLQHVTLDDDRPTEYGLRREPREGGLATLEAIARALRVLEGDAGLGIEAALIAAFHVMVSRTRWLRGQLRDDEVVGGVPPGATRGSPQQ